MADAANAVRPPPSIAEIRAASPAARVGDLAARLTELAHQAGDEQRAAERARHPADAHRAEGKSAALLEAARLAADLAGSL